MIEMRRLRCVVIAAGFAMTLCFALAPCGIAQAKTPDAAAGVQAVQPRDKAVQDAADDTLGPAFEVATIRPVNRDGGQRWYGFRLTPSGRFTGSSVSVSSLVGFAYGHEPERMNVVGGTGWINSDSFDINAKVDDAQMVGWEKLTDAQRTDRVKPMIRALLAERFRLKIHSEMRVMPVFALVQAKGGAKLGAQLKEVAPPPANADPQDMDNLMKGKFVSGKPGSFSMSSDGWSGYAIPISTLARQIEANYHEDRMLIDETGLKGNYDFTLKVSHEKDGPTLMEQVEEQLGLKLEARKMPIKTYIIDSAEKPSLDGAEVPVQN